MRKSEICVPIGGKKDRQYIMDVLLKYDQKFEHIARGEYLHYGESDGYWFSSLNSHGVKEITLIDLVVLLQKKKEQIQKIRGYAVMFNSQLQCDAIKKFNGDTSDFGNWRKIVEDSKGDKGFAAYLRPGEFRFNVYYHNNTNVLTFEEFAEIIDIAVPEEPLLITEDGFNLFMGDKYHNVLFHRESWVYDGEYTIGEDNETYKAFFITDNAKAFKDIKAAEAFVLKSTPISFISVDGKEMREGDEYFKVLETKNPNSGRPIFKTFTGNSYFTCYPDPIQPVGVFRFSSRYAADQWVNERVNVLFVDSVGKDIYIGDQFFHTYLCDKEKKWFLSKIPRAANKADKEFYEANQALVRAFKDEETGFNFIRDNNYPKGITLNLQHSNREKAHINKDGVTIAGSKFGYADLNAMYELAVQNKWITNP